MQVIYYLMDFTYTPIALVRRAMLTCAAQQYVPRVLPQQPQLRYTILACLFVVFAGRAEVAARPDRPVGLGSKRPRAGAAQASATVSPGIQAG